MILNLCRSAFVAAALAVVFSTPAAAYEVAYLEGGSWSTLYAQGFSTVLGATPSPLVSSGDLVYLQSFEFFKSGLSDNATDIRLAIIDNLYSGSPDFITTLTTNSTALVGLSTNTIASTASLATGDSILFSFDELPMVYDAGGAGDYAAVFVNVGVNAGSGAPLTPVRVSSLTANYIDNGSGTFVPASGYGTDSQFQYTTSNFINGDFFSGFTFAADANFRATFAVVPEPNSLVLLLAATMASSFRSRRGC